eukprot:scaffold45744_cov66-Phaeocystis_antarctica.AAC.1
MMHGAAPAPLAPPAPAAPLAPPAPLVRDRWRASLVLAIPGAAASRIARETSRWPSSMCQMTRTVVRSCPCPPG